MFDIFVDVDNTLINSTKKDVELLNKKLGTNVNYLDCKRYDFKDIFPDVSFEQIQEIFDSEEFFKDLDIFDDCKETLALASYFCKIKVVTLGSVKNLENKKKWIPNEFPYIYKFYGLTNMNPDKSNVNMHNGIFIDDHIDCLRSSNAKIKILFRNGLDTDWNGYEPYDDVYVVDSWEEIRDILIFYIKSGGII